MKIIVIHDEKLENRLPYINGTLDKIKNVIGTHTISEIKLITDNVDIDKTKIQQQKTGIDEFDRLLLPINNQQMSNIEKHKKALEYVINNKDEICWILEDDAVVSNEYLENLRQFVDNINRNTFKYDILFTSFSIPDESDKIQTMDTHHYKVIPSKSSYIIKPKTARNLILFLDKYMYNMRGMLSRFIYDNREWVKSVCMNKHILLEATKIGMLPTSINYSNMLIFNSDYIKMIRMLGSNDLNKEETINYIKTIKKKLEHLESADVYHLIGIMYHRLDMYDNAKDNMERSMEILRDKQGYIGKYSEILNNLINIYQYNQKDIDEYSHIDSKHTFVSPISSLNH